MELTAFCLTEIEKHKANHDAMSSGLALPFPELAHICDSKDDGCCSACGTPKAA